MTGEKTEKKGDAEKGMKGKGKGNWEEKSNPYYSRHVHCVVIGERIRLISWPCNHSPQ